VSDGQGWHKSHAVTQLWSNSDGSAIAFTQVPVGSVFEQIGELQGGRIPVHYFGNATAQAGDVWVDADDLEAADAPGSTPPQEPDWPNATAQAGDMGVNAADPGATDPPQSIPPAEPDQSTTGDGQFTPGQIASAIGCAVDAVQQQWPALVSALQEQQMTDRSCLIAALATIGVEAPAFQAMNEYGGDAYFTRMYEGRTDLGNDQPGDGARYHGRGFILLTGRANYRAYGQLLNIPLEDNPDLALDSSVAARILALYFQQRGIGDCARSGDWVGVRRRVNNGLNGWARFIELVNAFQAL
jgi:hypothetical protein